MRDILTDIYNKVLNFFQGEKEGENSKEIASNRLKLVLMQDRTNLDTATLEKMRVELVDVISRYVEIDQEAFNVNLAGEGDSIALMLNIPVIRAKTHEEIEAAEKIRKSQQDVKDEKEEAVVAEETTEESETKEETQDSEEVETEESKAEVEAEAEKEAETAVIAEEETKKK